MYYCMTMIIHKEWKVVDFVMLRKGNYIIIAIMDLEIWWAYLTWGLSIEMNCKTCDNGLKPEEEEAELCLYCAEEYEAEERADNMREMNKDG